tara:strand:- start:4941 stop:5636 length:696 start_codon:yes stop_codon:yes gene_type:complete
MQNWTASSASPIQIFLNADFLVQSVILLLLLASVASWTVIINRGWAIARERSHVRNARRQLTSVGTRSELGQLIEQERGQVITVLQAIDAEWRWSNEHAGSGYEKTHERILSVAEMAIAREARRLAGLTTWLATIGATAPFVGLFGTVWGIMASFLAIGLTQDTSLAVVAPGIAEALLATAIGLFCAIPAVIGYNRLQQGIGEIDAEWRSTAGLLEVAISRHFDTRAGRVN